MNLKRSSASRGELTKAMSATLREVRLHHDQIAALLAGMQQLMDGQAALGEALEALNRRIEALEIKSNGMMESLDLLDGRTWGPMASKPSAEKALKAIRVPPMNGYTSESNT